MTENVSRTETAYDNALKVIDGAADYARLKRQLRWTWIALSLMVALICAQMAMLAFKSNEADQKVVERTRVVERTAERAEDKSQDVVEYLRGEQGLPGAPGKPGANGVSLKGPRGDAGRDGQDGASGSDGSNGKDGADGPEGRNGVDGTSGKDGVDGADGPAGPAGPAGPQGPEGPTGPAGPAGPEGPAGPPGPGATGAATCTPNADGTFACVIS